MANLVIVESPSKAATIKGYLGTNYKVVASKGHVRDLPKSSLGVDIENDFAPHYINIRGKGDLIKEIKKEAKAAGKDPVVKVNAPDSLNPFANQKVPKKKPKTMDDLMKATDDGPDLLGGGLDLE